MTGEPLREDYDAFALGISEGEELVLIRKHLSDGCAVCVPALRNSLGFAASLCATVPQVDPPANLRRRILAMVEAKPSAARVAWLPWLAGLAVALGLLTVLFVVQRNASVSEARLNQAVGLLSASDLKQLAVRNSGSGNSRVDVFASRSRGVLLVASDFRAAPPGKTYEMWTIAKNAAPVAAGVFAPRPDGTVLHVAPESGDALAVVAVTVEPEGGSDHPTTKPFLVAALP